MNTTSANSVLPGPKDGHVAWRLPRKGLDWSLLGQCCHDSGKPLGPRPGTKTSDPQGSPPVRPPSSHGGGQGGGRSWGALGGSHLESPPPSGQSSLKAGEKPGGQGWSWQEPRGGRKQETIKEKSIPGRGLAQATGPCRLTSGRHGGGFLGADAACPTPCLPGQGVGVGGAETLSGTLSPLSAPLVSLPL